MKRLSSKLALALATGMLLILFCTIAIIIKSNYNSVESSVGGYSVQTAKSISKQIDSATYQEFLKNPSKTNVYWSFRKDLNRLREETGALYVYTLGVKEGKKVFILIDGQPRDSKVASDIGEPTSTTTYQDVKPALNGGTSHTPVVPDPKYGDYLSAFVPIKDSNNNVIGVLGVDIDAKMVGSITNEVNKSVLPYTIGLIALIFLIIVGSINWYLRVKLRPLQTISEASDEMANGQLQIAINSIDTLKIKGNDEIQRLVVSFKKMAGETNQMVHDMKDSSRQLLFATDAIEIKMNEIHATSQQIVQGIQHVAVATDSQLYTSTESVRTIEEMTTGIQRIADAASEVSESSISVTEQVKGGFNDLKDIIAQIEGIKSSVSDSSGIIKNLGDQTEEIQSIVNIISGIAEQTNLLALNAAIEAARAGEHGKGFAVVSQEVRKLAEESKNSAQKIAELINRFHSTIDSAVQSMNKSTEDVERGTTAIQQTGQKFTSVLQSVEAVSGEIEEVSAITEEMSASSEEISSSMNEFSNLLQSTAQMSKEAAASTDQQAEAIADISELTNKLKALSEHLEQSIEKFK